MREIEPLGASSARDPRIDFIRGFAAVSFVTSHFEVFTFLNFIFWERLGIFSGAELFVLVSGFLVGSASRAQEKQDGFSIAQRWWRRARTLYLAYIVIIALIIVFARLDLWDMTAVTTFTDRWAERTYPLIPAQGTPLLDQIKSVLLLQSTPHQVQILGLYVCLLLLVPLALHQLRYRIAVTVILCSVAGWAFSWWWSLSHPEPPMITGAQFEYGFPLLAWQIYFFIPMVLGYRRAELGDWLDRHANLRTVLIVLSLATAAASFVFAQTTDNPSFPAQTRLNIISPVDFRFYYNNFFQKDSLDPGRLVTSTSFIVSLYLLLTYFWPIFNKLLGWLFIPLGRASLYVFILHLPLLMIADQLPGYFDGVPQFDKDKIWRDTAILLAIIAALWLMVKNRVLFSVIPR